MGIDEAWHDEFTRLQLDQRVVTREQTVMVQNLLHPGRGHIGLHPGDVPVGSDSQETPGKCLETCQGLGVDHWTIVNGVHDGEYGREEGLQLEDRWSRSRTKTTETDGMVHAARQGLDRAGLFGFDAWPVRRWSEAARRAARRGERETLSHFTACHI